MSDVRDWGHTSIVDMKPGRIDIRGRPIDALIGTLSFSRMIWLMLRSGLSDKAQARLFKAALVTAVDHGPQAPRAADEHRRCDGGDLCPARFHAVARPRAFLSLAVGRHSCPSPGTAAARGAQQGADAVSLSMDLW
ncbi:hypothetical protein P279_19250 [Rhodobacteraceae bacterium PD-2]|nr:hypothetical protein P279_19250 [Rhodobacteraceae bacterium PD-2]